MLDKNAIFRLFELVKTELNSKEDQSVAHRWGHILRVIRNCIEIAKEYNQVDYFVLILAALLHDIDQPYYEKKMHAQLSARKAEKILLDARIPDKVIKKVINVILEHSSENPEIRPSSLESKILFDADKLDGLGAVGIARVFSYCGQKGLSPEEALKWYKQKIKLAAPQLQTEIGRRLAKEKIDYVYSFFKMFENENSVDLAKILEKLNVTQNVVKKG